MIKNNNILFNLYKVSKNIIFFIFLFYLINFQTSLSLFPIFAISTPNLILIIIYVFIVRLNIIPSNSILCFLGLLHDIMIGNNLGITLIYLLLFKYLTQVMILEKINKNNQDKWIFFTMIFVFSFSVVFFLNIIINMSVPNLSPIFFHVGVTLILYPIVNISISFFNYVTELIKIN